ncbi:MAG: hypothetical protein ACR2LE_05975 [Nocardioidaceae bacterium]
MELLDPGWVVFGQYRRYRSEPYVADDSNVEVFVAVVVAIGNCRCEGVLF